MPVLAQRQPAAGALVGPQAALVRTVEAAHCPPRGLAAKLAPQLATLVSAVPARDGIVETKFEVRGLRSNAAVVGTPIIAALYLPRTRNKPSI